MHEIRDVEPPIRGWTGYPLGFAAAITVTLVAVAAHGTAHPQWTLVALAATAAAIAAVATLRAALATAALCWALETGFVIGRRGVLTVTAESVRDAAILAAVALLAYAIALAVRIARRAAARRAARPVAIPSQRVPAVGVLRSTGSGHAL